MSTATKEKVQARPAFAIQKGAFYACDGSFRVDEFKTVSCGARSYYFALINGVQLSFCGHHGNKYEVSLMPLAKGNIIDLRHTILPEKDPTVD